MLDLLGWDNLAPVSQQCYTELDWRLYASYHKVRTDKCMDQRSSGLRLRSAITVQVAERSECDIFNLSSVNTICVWQFLCLLYVTASTL